VAASDAPALRGCRVQIHFSDRIPDGFAGYLHTIDHARHLAPILGAPVSIPERLQLDAAGDLRQQRLSGPHLL
jgi:hypothetical protein